jgi:predicted secreted hydrolase
LVIRAASLSLALCAVATASIAQTPGFTYPDVKPGRAFVFPVDHGAHPDFRTEWWYVTGTVKTAKGKDLGFQITFFRTRPRVDPRNPSKFAPRQILFAHAAVSDSSVGKLLHDQRAARSGFGIAEAKIGDADVLINDWRFVRLADGRFSARIVARGFALNLMFKPTQQPLLQGVGGYSSKGPDPKSASYYYSVPQLATRGTITRGKSIETVTGRSWLDREWSSRYLGGATVGWDWTGLNFDDGAALWRSAFAAQTAATSGPAAHFAAQTELQSHLNPATCASRQRVRGDQSAPGQPILWRKFLQSNCPKV